MAFPGNTQIRVIERDFSAVAVQSLSVHISLVRKSFGSFLLPETKLM